MRYITIILLVLAYTFAYSQPRIQIEGNDVYDWGKIDSKGKPLTAKVKIYNKGNETLKISEVKPGCGCTTAPLDKNDIEPNGFATLSITLNVSNEGPIQKSINISSNDPQAQNKHLILKANIFRPIGMSNRFLNFGDIELNKEANSSVTLKNNTNETLIITGIIAEPDDLSVSIKKDTKIPANNEVKLDVKYIAKKPNNLSGKVTLKTNNKEMETIEISVWGKFKQETKKQ